MSHPLSSLFRFFSLTCGLLVILVGFPLSFRLATASPEARRESSFAKKKGRVRVRKEKQPPRSRVQRERRWLAQLLPRPQRPGRQPRRLPRFKPAASGGGLRSSPAPANTPIPSVSSGGASGSITGTPGTTKVIGGRDNCKFKWSQKVRPDFKKADVITLVKWIAKQTCQNFIVSDKVMRTPLYVISERDVTLRDAYNAFLAALRESQMLTVRVGRFWKLVPITQARQVPITTITNENTKLIPGRDEIITYIYRLKYLDANQVAGLVRQLITAGAVIPYPTNGVLIMTDYGPNIRRVVGILRALDIEQAAAHDRMYILQVRYAQAQEMAAKIQQLFQVGQQEQVAQRRPGLAAKPIAGKPAAPAPGQKGGDESADAYRLSKIVADERTNQLVVLCSPLALKRVSKFLSDLDIPLPDDGQIRVHNLKFASAEELAQTLSQLTQGTSSQRQRPVRRPATTAQKKASELFEGEVKITADKATNSLVIVASRRDYESLMRVVERLDIARKQVFVEIVILEVSVDKSRDLGLTFNAGSNLTGDAQQPTLGLLGTQLGGLNSLVLDPSALTGLALGLRGSDVPGSAGLFGNSAFGLPSFGVVVRALQSNTDVDIISTPHVLTTANEEATLQVGQNVPFIAGTTITGGIAGGIPAIRNIQRQDVALTLKLKPQIDAGSYIRMDFEQELTELAGQDPELGPTTTKRKIKTVVLAKDNQTVVIGGLMRDKVTNGVSKVPILGDIPLLGTLFKVQNRIVEKRNLLVFMTPYIIHSMYDFKRIFRNKMKERQDFLDTFYAYSRKKTEPYTRGDKTFGIFERMVRRMDQGKSQAREMEKQGVKPVTEKAKISESKKTPAKAEPKARMPAPVKNPATPALQATPEKK
jgi:general secretion pathway protein D